MARNFDLLKSDEIKTGNFANQRERITKRGVKELASSIEEVGLLEPLIVRPNNGVYDLVCGFRRYEACKHLGMKEIPVVVVDGMPEEQVAIYQLVENVQREDITPLEEANTFLALQKRDMSVTEIAKRVGVSKAHVSQRLKLLDADPDVQKAVASGDIPVSSVRDIVRLSPNEQKRVLKDAQKALDRKAKLTKTGKPSKKKAKGKAIKDAAGKRTGEKPGKKKHKVSPEKIAEAFDMHLDAFREKLDNAPSQREVDLLDKFFVYLVNDGVLLLK